MKSRILLSAVAVFACISLFSFMNKQTQSSSSEFVTIRTFEPMSGGLANPALIVSYGNGKTEKIDLKKVNATTAGENANVLIDQLNKLSKEGYKLKTATGGDYANTYVLVKE